MKRRLLAIFLSVAMICSFAPAALAEESTGTVLPDAEEGVITLTEDVTISSGFPTSGTIDLAGFTLTYTGSSITVNDTDLTIKDSAENENERGTLVLETALSSSSSYFCAESGGSVTVSNIDIKSTGSVFYPKGNASAVNIDNCTVYTTGAYCVATNAASVDNYGVEISITDSKLTADASDGDDCAVLINVAGTLTIDNSTITGDRQAVIVRAGTATITNSTLTSVPMYLSYGDDDPSGWGNGNEVAYGALIVGNNTANSYLANAKVTVEDCTISVDDSTVSNSYAIYAVRTGNETYTTNVEISGSETSVTGTVAAKANEGMTSTISISGGTYSSNVSEYVATGYTAELDENSGTYVIETAPLTASVGTNEGTTTVSISGDLTVGLDEDSGFEDDTTHQSTEIIVDATSQGGDSTTTEITITGTALDSISHSSTAAETLTINSNVGTLSLDTDALAAMLENATDDNTGEISDIVVKIAAVDGAENTYVVTAKTTDDIEVYGSSISGGIVEITVSFASSDYENVLVYCTDNGLELMEITSYNETNETVTWTTTHFSTYVLLQAGSGDEVTYQPTGGTAATGTLDSALTECANGGTITTLANCELTSNIPSSVTLTVSDGTTLTIESTDVATVLGQSKGTLIVEAGGALVVADATWIGDLNNSDANLQLTSGTVTVDLSNISQDGIVIELNGDATVAGYWTLTTNSVAMNVEVTDGSTLTIANGGQLAVANGSKLTNEGTISVESGGVLRVNSQGTLTGDGSVTDAGSVTVHTDGTNNAKVACTINIVSGGAVYSQLADNTELVENLEGSYRSSAGTYTVSGVTDNGTTGSSLTFEMRYYYYKSSSSSSSGGSSSGSSSTYSVTVEDSDNGSVSSNRSSASKGTTVTLTISPDDGYELDELTVTNASTGDTISLTQSSDTKYTFTMPSAEVTVEATFVESAGTGAATDADMIFVDVDEGDYYYDAVLWAVENGITTGTSATTFSPDASCTRAQMVTFLWRAAGSPVPSSTSCAFTDLDSSDYYYNAVLWAVENGITNGTSDTTFSPNDTVTRSQTVTLLYRYEDTTSTTGTLPYTDVSTDAYYYNAVLWANENDITNGTSSTTFSPEDDCTRAQIVTFLYRYMG